jgi:hypothetical protein
LSRRERGLDLRGLAWAAVRCGIGAAAAGAVAYGVVVLVGSLELGGAGAGESGLPSKLALLLEAGLATVAGGLAYLAVAVALRIPELPSIVAIMTDLVRRRGRS